MDMVVISKENLEELIQVLKEYGIELDLEKRVIRRGTVESDLRTIANSIRLLYVISPLIEKIKKEV